MAAPTVSVSARRKIATSVRNMWKNARLRRRRIQALKEASANPEVRTRRSIAQKLFAKEHPERKQNGGRPVGTLQSLETRKRIGIGSKWAWRNKESAANRAKKVSATNKRLYLEGKISLPGPNTWHRQVYKGIVMRSSWEVAFAKWCDSNKVKWFYEPKRFPIPRGSYTPDFYLPTYDLWIEVKGAMMSDPLKRFLEFRKLHPNIWLLDRDALREVGVL